MKSTFENFAHKLSTDLNEKMDSRDKRQTKILVNTLVRRPTKIGTEKTHKHVQACVLRKK